MKPFGFGFGAKTSGAARRCDHCDGARGAFLPNPWRKDGWMHPSCIEKVKWHNEAIKARMMKGETK